MRSEDHLQRAFNRSMSTRLLLARPNWGIRRRLSHISEHLIFASPHIRLRTPSFKSLPCDTQNISFNSSNTTMGKSNAQKSRDKQLADARAARSLSKSPTERSGAAEGGVGSRDSPPPPPPSTHHRTAMSTLLPTPTFRSVRIKELTVNVPNPLGHLSLRPRNSGRTPALPGRLYCDDRRDTSVPALK